MSILDRKNKAKLKLNKEAKTYEGQDKEFMYFMQSMAGYYLQHKGLVKEAAVESVRVNNDGYVSVELEDWS